MARFRNDPYGFVIFNWPWGQEGTELEHESGPEEWQRDWLLDLGKKCEENAFDGKTPVDPVRMATVSGHGIGKTALTCWVILWVMSTRPKCNVTVTASNLPQLQHKTWAQLAKWKRLALNGDWFEYSNSRGNLSLRAKAHEEEWFTIGITCKEENSEAFQGQHAPTSSSVYIFDEASAVPDIIWEAAEGGLTDGEPMFFVFGNPTRNVGAFADCFGKNRHRWIRRQIDSRTVSRGNKKLFEEWIEDYGEDSDWVRVRVRGVFPRAGSSQFIGNDIVALAKGRVVHPSAYTWSPKLIGVDVAREGDDQSVIIRRQGLMVQGIRKLRLDDLMVLASHIVREIEDYDPDAVFLDAVGVGAGVLDRLRQLGKVVVPVKASEKATKPGYYNMRAQMWGDMREWLKNGGCIPDDPDLERELISQEYGFSHNELIQLVGKKEMKNMGVPSPDIADALSFTFAYPVSRDDAIMAFRRVVADNKDWDPVPLAGRWKDPLRR